MDLKATETGLLIPKEFLNGQEDFEILLQFGRGILVVPKPDPAPSRNSRTDPIDESEGGGKSNTLRGSWDKSIFSVLGVEPIDDGPSDASVRHDDYLCDRYVQGGEQ